MSYRDDIRGPFRWIHNLWLVWLRGPAKSRVDRSRMYVWVHTSLVVTGFGLFVHPYGVGALAFFDRGHNKMLALCMVIGSTLALTGSLMGGRFWFPSAQTDVRLPYVFAVGGQLSVIFALGTYVSSIIMHSQLTENMAGALTFGILGGCTQTALVCIKEIHRINRLEKIIERRAARAALRGEVGL